MILSCRRLLAPAILGLALSFALAACTPGSSAIVDSFRLLRRGDAPADAAPLRPDLRYLRVTTQGRVALLVLGYVEPGAQGETEVWYSGTGEVLRLRQGRIIGTTGLATDWRQVRLPALPAWGEIAGDGLQYRRERDVMPGYLYNLGDTLALRPIAAPAKSALKNVAADKLRWFEEFVVSGSEELRQLPPARYAIAIAQGRETPTYGEQCLAADLCLTWQRWPAQ